MVTVVLVPISVKLILSSGSLWYERWWSDRWNGLWGSDYLYERWWSDRWYGLWGSDYLYMKGGGQIGEMGYEGQTIYHSFPQEKRGWTEMGTKMAIVPYEITMSLRQTMMYENVIRSLKTFILIWLFSLFWRFRLERNSLVSLKSAH